MIAPMQAVADKYIEQVREIVLAHTKGLPVEVYFFGSRADGTHEFYSDVDIAIEAKGNLPRTLFPDLTEALEESTVPYRVDVVNLKAADEIFRAKVKRTGIKWQTLKSE
jgi:uncharacterized protein